jgi:hypothetical protein
MKNLNKIHRRNFLKSLGLLSLAPFINACENSVSSNWGEDNPGTNRPPTPPKVDILLDGTEEQIAKAIQNKDSMIQDLYNNPGKEMTIGFLQDRAYNILKLSFVKDNIVSYPHLKIVNTKTNEIANLVWGMEGIYPSIKFVDNSGKTIVKNGKTLEFALKIPGKIQKTNSPGDWILTGMKVFGIALLIWIGFSIVKYVAAAIAFIAFNAMAIGLVIAGTVILVEIIRWVLDTTGITLYSIIDFFRQTIAAMVSTLMDIVNYLLGYSG